jgi:Protein of unknown function (DUF3501)
MTSKYQLTRADIIDIADYANNRSAHRKRVTEIKRRRRVEVGPFATFYFENFDTMWHQVHEMLHIERGGEAQIADELDAYNPLIPRGGELVATLMLEIDDSKRRDAALATLGGIEHCTYLSIGDERVAGEPDPTRENTSSEGKASAVQFIRFPFSPTQIARFRGPKTTVLVGIDHRHYGHIAVMPDTVRAALAADFTP